MIPVPWSCCEKRGCLASARYHAEDSTNEGRMVMTAHDVLRPPPLSLTRDAEPKRGNFKGRLRWRGAEGARDMWWTDGVTPAGCTWLIWAGEWLTLCPAPPHMCLGNVNRCWAGKCQRTLKYPKWELQLFLKCIPNFLSQQAMPNPWATAQSLFFPSLHTGTIPNQNFILHLSSWLEASNSSSLSELSPSALNPLKQTNW